MSDYVNGFTPEVGNGEYKAGQQAYLDGKPLNSNPWINTRHYRWFVNWDGGWKASEAADKK